VEFSPAEVVSQCLKTLSVEASRKRLTAHQALSPSIPRVCIGDPNRLRQVLLNLIGNAIKFTREGSVTVRANVDEKDESGLTLHFEVVDTGVGIPVEKQKMIFDAFSQCDQSISRRFGGTGLGLTISTRLVGMMGGRMWVDSQPGEGSVFHFTIRLERKAFAPAGAAEPLSAVR